MCYPYPGPRCSSYTRKMLESISQQRQHAELRLNQQLQQFSQVQETAGLLALGRQLSQINEAEHELARSWIKQAEAYEQYQETPQGYKQLRKEAKLAARAGEVELAKSLFQRSIEMEQRNQERKLKWREYQEFVGTQSSDSATGEA